MVEQQPWDSATAEKYIHQLACEENLTQAKTLHYKTRMAERGIIASDVRHVLKHGSVIGEAEASTREGLFKYKIQCETPNSDGGIIRVVVIPCREKLLLKIVTVMWVGGGHSNPNELAEETAHSG